MLAQSLNVYGDLPAVLHRWTLTRRSARQTCSPRHEGTRLGAPNGDVGRAVKLYNTCGSWPT